MVFEQLTSLPVALLCASAAVSIGTGGLADAVVIMGVVAANAAIGYLTESHAERVIASLEGGSPPPARVLRDGLTREVSTEEVVRGDLLRLEPGGHVAGDARIVTADGLSVDESSLTGESLPVRKHADPLPKAGLPLADRRNIAFRGTTVTSGSGSALVFATGAATEVGRVQAVLGTVGSPQTPLQRQLDDMGRRLVLLCGGLCAVIFAMGVLRRMAVLPMFKTAVSLAVAALPEGLPAVATSTLALGIGRMRRHGVLVRKLPAIETLGAVQTLCFDKTGTLTRNRMSVTAVGLGCGPRYRCGQTPTEILALGEGPLEDGARALLEVCALCSDATVDGTGDTSRIMGSPTEAALLRFALDAGIDVVACRRARPVVEVEHRTDARPLLATHHNGPENRLWTAVKGNPAAVLERCNTVREARAKPSA
jgi:Ca2+-transporting ATPase